MPLPGDAALARIEPRAAGRPFVVAQLGQSLDGRIATLSGQSRGLGGSASLDHLHALRARVGAVLVGIGTVLADDPRLDVRRCAGTNPARIVLDARGGLSPAARCLAGEARRIVFRAPECPAVAVPGVETVALAAPEGRFALDAVIDRIGALGIGSLLIEGGSCIVSRAIEAGLVDRLHLMVSPVILGAGRAGLDFAAAPCLDAARRPGTDIYLLGEGEVLFDCDLRS